MIYADEINSRANTRASPSRQYGSDPLVRISTPPIRECKNDNAQTK